MLEIIAFNPSVTTRLVILDLTKYEIGNVIRFDKKISDRKILAKYWNKILKSIRAFSISNFEETEELATENKLTFYDAAYIELARELKINLITEDKEVLNSFPGLALSISRVQKDLNSKG
jgi:predicted nucleic acid-binding protein